MTTHEIGKRFGGINNPGHESAAKCHPRRRTIATDIRPIKYCAPSFKITFRAYSDHVKPADFSGNDLRNGGLSPWTDKK